MSGTLPANTTLTSSANLDKRVRTALRILKLAADQEHGLANATLGHIYETGGYEDQQTGRFHTFLKKNPEKALHHYKIGAEQNDELALNFMGAHCFNVEKKEVEAVNYFRRAS